MKLVGVTELHKGPQGWDVVDGGTVPAPVVVAAPAQAFAGLHSVLGTAFLQDSQLRDHVPGEAQGSSFRRPIGSAGGRGTPMRDGGRGGPGARPGPTHPALNYPSVPASPLLHCRSGPAHAGAPAVLAAGLHRCGSKPSLGWLCGRLPTRRPCSSRAGKNQQRTALAEGSRHLRSPGHAAGQ